ncbi:hypothetical protein JGU66_10410 [Myxococcaceae bacterium JPH2]|nr:hypothetical protein [Myxococcaceae bacterium JPH2]
MLKQLWVGASLMLGLGLGFVAGGQEPAAAGWKCTMNSQCDRACGAPRCGICDYEGTCWCGCMP